MNILTKNGLCAMLKQYPNMPIFVQSKDSSKARKPHIVEGFYDPANPSNVWTTSQKSRDGSQTWKPCLILY